MLSLRSLTSPRSLFVSPLLLLLLSLLFVLRQLCLRLPLESQYHVSRQIRPALSRLSILLRYPRRQLAPTSPLVPSVIGVSSKQAL